MSKSKGRRLAEWLRNLDSNSRAGSNTLADDSVGSDQLAHDLALQGNPTAATQSTGNNSTRLATTAFVATEVAALVDSAPGTLNTLNELAAALGDDANFSTTVTNSIATKAPLASPALTGTPTAPTASSGTNTTQVATTAFVTAATSGLATDANVANKAPINSPTFTGTPAAPTASAGTNTTQIATTAFVTTAVAAGGGGVSGISSSADATAITIDSSERVGIGATSPVGILHIKSDDNGVVFQSSSSSNSRAQIFFQNNGGTTTGKIAVDPDGGNANVMAFSTGSSERMRIDASGNVGIGHSGSLVNKLTVNGNQVMLASGEMKFADAGNSLVSVIKNGGSSGTSQMQFLVGSTPAEVMRIDSNGDVGIGMTDPTSKLHVSGSSGAGSRVHIQSTGAGLSSFDGSGPGLLMTAGGMNTTSKFTPSIQFGSTDPQFTTTSPKVGAAINGVASQSYSADDKGGMELAFYTTPNDPGTGQTITERMRIDNAGNVGIGNDNPTATLDVNGTIKLDGNYPVGTGNVALGDTALDSLTDGSYNTAIGRNALTACTSGGSNVAVGNAALGGATIANYNTAVGFASCLGVTTGGYNTGVGASTLRLTTTGSRNTAVGYDALKDNTTGERNTSVGYAALANNTTGNYNDALGYTALNTNTTGSYNTALGYAALYSNNADANVAVGYAALNDNTSGTYNTTVGYGALTNNTTGSYGLAIGAFTLHNNTTQNHNFAMGYAAGYGSTTGNLNMFLGNYAGYSNTTASYSVCIGYYSGYNTTTNGYNAFVGYYAGSNGTGGGYGNVAIGYNCQIGASGNTRTQSIVLGYGTQGVGSGYFTFGTGTGNSRVYNQFGANASWTRVSDQRYKTDIQDNTNCGLAFINDLRPVTFKWKPKSEIDNTLPDYDADATAAEYSPKMYGLIAQEVKQVLDNHNITDFGGWHEDEDSGIQGISQEMFIYPLIKAVQELSAKVTALENGG